MIRLLFTVDMFQRLYVFSDVLYFIEAVIRVQYIITFSTLSGVRIVFCILPQLDILCTSAIKLSPVLSVSEFTKAKNLPFAISSSDLNLLNFLLRRALQEKLYREDFRNFNHLKHVLLHCWTRVIRMQCRLTAKIAVMVSGVYSKHVEFLFTY